MGFRRTGAGKPESFQTSCPSQVPWRQQSLWSLLCPFDQNLCFFVSNVPFRLGEHWVLGTDWHSDRGAAEAVVAHGGKCTHEADQHSGVFGYLSKQCDTFSPPDSMTAVIFWGTWTSRHLGSKIFSMKCFLLWFSSAAIIDCGLRELQPLLHPVFYVQLSFGVRKAFHVLILCSYWFHFKNTSLLNISDSHR